MAAITPKLKNGKVGSYRIRACVGRDEKGKQMFRCMTWKVPDGMPPSKAEKAVQKAAAQWEKTARQEYEEENADPQKAKLREIERLKTDFVSFALEEWFPVCVNNGEKKPTTVVFYRRNLPHIVEFFEGKMLQGIRATDIQKFLIFLRTEKGLAPQTVHHHHRTLNMIFGYAMSQGLLKENPMDNVERPKLPRRKVDALSQEEARKFFDALEQCQLEFRCLLTLLVTTGMRRGSALVSSGRI